MAADDVRTAADADATTALRSALPPTPSAKPADSSASSRFAFRCAHATPHLFGVYRRVLQRACQPVTLSLRRKGLYEGRRLAGPPGAFLAGTGFSPHVRLRKSPLAWEAGLLAGADAKPRSHAPALAPANQPLYPLPPPHHILYYFPRRLEICLTNGRPCPPKIAALPYRPLWCYFNKRLDPGGRLLEPSHPRWILPERACLEITFTVATWSSLKLELPKMQFERAGQK